MKSRIIGFFGSIEDEIATNRDPMTEAVRIPFQIFEKVKFSRKKPKNRSFSNCISYAFQKKKEIW